MKNLIPHFRKTTNTCGGKPINPNKFRLTAPSKEGHKVQIGWSYLHKESGKSLFTTEPLNREALEASGYTLVACHVR